MIKHLSKISGVAAFAALATSASAEVAINENLSLDGYATAAAVVTEPSPGAKDKVLFNSNRLYDSAKVALNGKYDAFTSKVSIYNLKSSKNGKTADAGLLDAYVTYKTGDIAVTGGQFNGWMGYESFDTPSNAFIDYGPAGYGYNAYYGTGAKVEYITKAYSTGVSARDSALGGDSDTFMGGDGDFSDDLGYEAYFLYTGVEKLSVFVGGGYEDAEGAADATKYFSAWASYALTDKLTLVGEYGSIVDAVDYSYTFMATYAVTDALSVAGRYGFLDSATGSDYTEFGVASTYTFTKNFSLKGEATKRDLNSGGADAFFYAAQGIFKF